VAQRVGRGIAVLYIKGKGRVILLQAGVAQRVCRGIAVLYIKGKGTVILLQARCGPEGG